MQGIGQGIQAGPDIAAEGGSVLSPGNPSGEQFLQSTGDLCIEVVFRG